ncbi:ABC transporter substrate-binding protein [Curtobacterium sp. Leaf261]|uniref:ABC transporter substrate-binding protein n=1 Tax=Curtobacterium sp. Leaf261 TaxID=1736311 RepID=UPI0006FF4FE7|nr:sugar ABC transporter substrate-binding protein [Curtobacterium sp. Leaf261]KQO61502.1 sugar ABC transporter substrate-binding protein [Curtobacterium sp. Leaf261]
MSMSRRRFLGVAGVSVGSMALAGCGFIPQSSGSEADADTLAFTTWGTDDELAGFRAAIKDFEREYPGRSVALNAVPYEQMFTNIDAQLQAGNPPDVFRVPYYTFGAYAGRGQLLDLSRSLNAGVGDRFTDAAWAAVQANGRPFGVPHHTDTSAILVNTKMLRDAGITELPTTAADAWTWDELASNAQKLRDRLPDSRYPFAYNWQGNGVTRWLNLLFQADGAFLETDQKTPAIDSAAGREAVAFAQRFFDERWVPKNDSIKSATYASDSWYSETVAMVWSGGFQIPDAAKTLDFEWTAIPAPRKVRGGSDFGGNALVATAQTTKPDLAASFLDFVTRREQMRDFCARASLLPTRRDLGDGDFRFTVRPELTPVFLAQAGTIEPQDVAQVASPDMSAIITVLQNGLEDAFVGGTSAADTVASLAEGIAAATGGAR